MPVSRRVLSTLAKAMDARLLLDLGTFTGYSSIAMALATADDAKVICCEPDPRYAAHAREWWAKAGCESKMEMHEIGAEELVQFLLHRGASTSLERSTDGATALSIALTRNHRSIVTRLVNTRGPLPLSGGSGSGSRGRPAKSSGRKKK